MNDDKRLAPSMAVNPLSIHTPRSALRTWAGLAMVGIGLLAACGPTRRGPPFVAEWEITDPQLLLGQQTFDTYCQQCHPGGAGGLGPAINDKPLPGWLIKFQVRNGIGAMPAFSSRQLPDDELDATVRYLKYLRGLDP